MTDLKFVPHEGEPSTEDMAIISKGMLAHHASQGHPRTWKTYTIFLRDETNKLFGSVIYTITWNGMRINTLWVDESLRGQGWGRKLMEAAEKDAIKKGCTIAYTDTFAWQAPKFYEKLGYSLYGKLDNYPTGSSLFYYQKKL